MTEACLLFLIKPCPNCTKMYGTPHQCCSVSMTAVPIEFLTMTARDFTLVTLAGYYDSNHLKGCIVFKVDYSVLKLWNGMLLNGGTMLQPARKACIK